MIGQGHGTATDEQHFIKLDGATELAAGLSVQALDQLVLGRSNLSADIVVPALQSHYLVLHGVGQQSIANNFKIEACLQRLGECLFDIQQAESIRAG